MKVYPDRMGDASEVPIWDCFASPSIHIWVPRYGWVRSQPLKKGRVVLTMIPILTKNIERWVKDKARTLHTARGCLCVVTLNQGPKTLIGLYHDTQIAPHDWLKPWSQEIEVPGTGKPWPHPYDWRLHLERWDARATRRWKARRHEREAREKARARALKRYLKQNTLSTPADFTKLMDNFVARGLLVIPPKQSRKRVKGPTPWA